MPTLGRRTSLSFILLIFFLSTYCFTLSGVIRYGDDEEKYLVAQSLVERQDFSIRPTEMRNEVGSGGRTFSVYELGSSLAEVPFYFLGRSLAQFMPVPDTNWMTMLTVGLMNPLLTAFGCVLLFETFLLLGCRPQTSVALTLVYGLATIAFPYAKDFNREPLLTVLILALVYSTFAFRQTRDRRWLLASSLVAGVLVFTKLIQAAILPIFVLYVYGALRQARTAAELRSMQRRDIALAVAVIALPTLAALGLQMAYAFIRFGTLYGGIGGTRTNPLDVIIRLISTNNPLGMSARLLLSPDRSIFIFSPPILLFPIAWLYWLKAKKWEAGVVLGVIIVAFLSAALRADGEASGWWGPRYFVQITPLFLLPLGAMLESNDRRARWSWIGALGILSIVGFAVQLVGVFTSSRDHLDILGYGPTILNQIEFLRHGALDSLFISLSPIRVNFFAVVLLGVMVLLGIRLASEIFHAGESAFAFSDRRIVVGVIVAVEITAFLIWVVAPYPRVLAARANNQYGAGNRFLAEGNACIANALYLAALNGGTDYAVQAAAHVNELLELDRGEALAADDLVANVEAVEGARTEVDTQQVGLSGEDAIRIFAPMDREATITVLSRDLVASPNMTYRLSGWSRLLNVYGTGAMIVTVYEDNGSWSKARSTEITSRYRTGGWQPFWGTVTTLPSTRRVIIKIGLWKTFGTVWVGDVHLAPAPLAPSSAQGLQPPCSLMFPS